MTSTLNVQYHDFQVVKQLNNVVLAKCGCCSPPRWGVFLVNNGNRIFYYHGYDLQYAHKLFSSLSGQRGGDND